MTAEEMTLPNVRHRFFIRRGALGALLAVAGWSTIVAAQGTAGISGFQAFLFNSRTGTLSPDVLKAGTDLGNVPAGEFASISTLVVVDLAFGKDAPVPTEARVRLVATEAGNGASGGASGGGGKPASRILLDSSARLGPVGPDGTTHIGFWLPATGCRTITLKAILTGAPGAARTATLPFACYE